MSSECSKRRGLCTRPDCSSIDCSVRRARLSCVGDYRRHPAPLTLIPALLALSHPQGRLCLSCSVASPKNTALHPLFEPRSTSLKKETPICSVCEGDEQRTYLAGLRKFCKHSLLNSFFIRRDIAGALLKAQEYNL